MTHQNVPRRTRRMLILRAALNASCILLVYFTAPLSGEFRLATLAWLAGGLVALGCVVAWQARAIVRAHYPWLRAIEALATSIPLFLVLFAAAYVVMSNSSPDAFSERLSRVDALYFAVTTFATVGFGDITPDTAQTRILAMVQMLGDLIVIGLVARVFLDAVRQGLERRDRTAGNIAADTETETMPEP